MVTTPTIGRKVWFRPGLYDKVGQHAMVIIDEKQPLDATVVHVTDDRCVNLLVLDHEGYHHRRFDVPLYQPGDTQPAEPHHGYCEWMPYQVKQHEKHAEQK